MVLRRQLVVPLFFVSSLIWAQPPEAPANREAPVSAVPFERILRASQEPQNWLTYSGSTLSQRHSALTQITPANAKDLTLQWVFQSRSLEKHEVTPLVVDGVMYTVQGINDVIALNATTGKTIWTYRYKPDAVAHNCCGQETRGLAILGDKIFLAALDNNVIAIDSKTGKEVWRTQAADPKQGYAMTHAPLAIKDKVIAGVAGGEYGIRGFVAAFDANTGKEVWRFYTIPGPGEPGNETWSGDSWKHGSGAIWVTGSYDPETNLTYWGTGNAGPDWNGDARLGDNLYTSSVIALDADTGKLKWHYQFSPHNEFDWDSTQVPVLADIQWQGLPRKVMLWANRNGMFYVLDRTSGQFLLGKPFVKVNWATGFDEQGRPMRTPGIEPTKAGTLVYPGNQGGTNWYNPSFSPRTGLFYIPAWENSSSIYVKGEEPPDFVDGKMFTGAFPSFNKNPDEFAAIRAVDPQTGEKKWDYRLSAPNTEAGILTTASDVLFSGGRDGAFYALDARDGKLLWETNLGPSVAAGPMTYAVNGKQYVSIQAGSALFTFSLR
ncbi:MAG TPA: PQQ-dependent dehydrogenase, methanol/ethanol family [Bryobacteraceae bacterium]|nr:PQQ-dependent dehydrogenase, methanol/ethanol family [Bryobacteraceae bacterium]